MNKLKLKCIIAGSLLFFLGLTTGAYLFTGVQKRPPLPISNCAGLCYNPSNIYGLIASAGIRHAPGAIPGLVKETGRCLAISHPFPNARYHFVVFPKKDILDIGDVSAGDEPYLMDCLGIMQSLIREFDLRHYRVSTNGPDFQQVRYLHFHLISD